MNVGITCIHSSQHTSLYRDGVVEVCKEESKQSTGVTMDTWSDCLTTKLHPNSVMTIPNYWHNEYVHNDSIDMLI